MNVTVALLAIALFCYRIHVRDVRTRLVSQADLLALAVIRLVLLALALFPLGAAGATDWLLWHFDADVWGARSLAVSALCGTAVVLLMELLGAAVSRLSGRSALGVGDVKLYFVCCLFLDPQGVAALLLASSVAGCAMAAWYRFVKKQDAFPFAPAIVWSFLGVLVLSLL